MKNTNYGYTVDLVADTIEALKPGEKKRFGILAHYIVSYYKKKYNNAESDIRIEYSYFFDSEVESSGYTASSYTGRNIEGKYIKVNLYKVYSFCNETLLGSMIVGGGYLDNDRYIVRYGSSGSYIAIAKPIEYPIIDNKSSDFSGFSSAESLLIDLSFLRKGDKWPSSTIHSLDNLLYTLASTYLTGDENTELGRQDFKVSPSVVTIDMFPSNDNRLNKKEIEELCFQFKKCSYVDGEYEFKSQYLVMDRMNGNRLTFKYDIQVEELAKVSLELIFSNDILEGNSDSLFLKKDRIIPRFFRLTYTGNERDVKFEGWMMWDNDIPELRDHEFYSKNIYAMLKFMHYLTDRVINELFINPLKLRYR